LGVPSLFLFWLPKSNNRLARIKSGYLLKNKSTSDKFWRAEHSRGWPGNRTLHFNPIRFSTVGNCKGEGHKRKYLGKRHKTKQSKGKLKNPWRAEWKSQLSWKITSCAEGRGFPTLTKSQFPNQHSQMTAKVAYFNRTFAGLCLNCANPFILTTLNFSIVCLPSISHFSVFRLCFPFAPFLAPIVWHCFMQVWFSNQLQVAPTLILSLSPLSCCSCRCCCSAPFSCQNKNLATCCHGGLLVRWMPPSRESRPSRILCPHASYRGKVSALIFDFCAGLQWQESPKRKKVQITAGF